MTKTEQILQQTCLDCLATFQLLEIHEAKIKPCGRCLKVWSERLYHYYQQQIILHLAQEEADKDGGENE